jgi:hypothetical protein
VAASWEVDIGNLDATLPHTTNAGWRTRGKDTAAADIDTGKADMQTT